MFCPFFRADSQWRTWDIWRILLFLLLLLLTRICRGTFLLRLLLILLLLRLLMITLHMVLSVTRLVAPALAISSNGLYPSLRIRRPYGYDAHSPCP